MESLRALMTTTAEVERADRRDEIDAAELVPGDVVGIEACEQVPADLRLFEAEDLRVDEAGLTGENEPVTKAADPVEASAPLAERTSMLYTGTTVVAGAAVWWWPPAVTPRWAGSRIWPSRPRAPRRRCRKGSAT